MSLANKQTYKAFLDAFAYPDRQGYVDAVRDFFAPDAEINVAHPLNALSGADGYIGSFLEPLMASFEGLHCRYDILMDGSFSDGEWVTSTGYFAGHFAKDWLGIKASGALAYVRFGEFHRMDMGKAVESYLFLDLPELMIATGQWPITSSPGKDRGYTGFLPGPATRDGVSLTVADPVETDKSLTMVTDMLLALNTPDEAWRPYWHDNMVWYGPAAFGSFIGIENFAGFQVPFEKAFDGWAGGAAGNGRTRHFTRFADGNYTCSGGWPSLSGVQIGTYLDQPPTNTMLYMRVCDWWRRDGDKLVENWVFVDIPHVLLQMGYDLFGRLREQRA